MMAQRRNCDSMRAGICGRGIAVRIQVMSDLHVEFYPDGGKRLLESLPVLCDCLVVAGDLATVDLLDRAIRLLCGRFPVVVFVTGNHEYYGAAPWVVHDVLERLSRRLSNFRWLRNSTAEVGGLKFGGTTLWFRYRPDPALDRTWSDFSEIKGFRDFVIAENRAALGFLDSSLESLDVVVTHHLPTPKSIDKNFADAPTNRYFLCNVEPIPVGPRLWIHGHVHASCDYVVGKGPLRVVANPLGYPDSKNPLFDPGLLVEVP